MENNKWILNGRSINTYNSYCEVSSRFNQRFDTLNNHCSNSGAFLFFYSPEGDIIKSIYLGWNKADASLDTTNVDYCEYISGLASRIYFIKIITSEKIATKRLVILQVYPLLKIILNSFTQYS